MAGSSTRLCKLNLCNRQEQTVFNACLAFTLIELLIVVAIIAILAAIAVPNFLEAQTRAKISRCKADFNSIATAMESYVIDAGQYPVGTMGDTFWNQFRLTTPVAYMNSVTFKDTFQPRDPSISNPNSSYLYYSYRSPGMYSPAIPSQGSFIPQCVAAWIKAERAPKLWLITSLGPDRKYDALVLAAVFTVQNRPPDAIVRYYDATNGTVSTGDLGRYGGAVPGGVPLR